MKKGRRQKKRKRGAASRARVRVRESQEREAQRFLELKEETTECFEKIVEKYPMKQKEREMLEYEWELGLQVIVDYEDETPEFLADLDIGNWDSDNLSDMMDPIEDTEEFWRASFELANALGLAMIEIDEDGNISGDRINY